MRFPVVLLLGLMSLASLAGCGPRTYAVPSYAASRPVQSFTHTCRASRRASENPHSESLLRIHTANRVVDYCIRVDGETVAVDPKPGVLDALAHGKEVEHGFVVAPGEHHVEIDVAYADGSISSSYRTYSARGRTCTRLGLDGNDSLEDCVP